MPYGQINADQISTSVQGYSLGAGNSSLLKNKIINGACVIDQRNAGASVTITSDGQYTVDRFKCNASQSSKISAQQNAGSVTPPAGFSNYLGITSLSSYSIGSTDYFAINQNIEGYNMADLNWGTANAKTITLSAWVYSSLTGTFGGCVRNSSGGYCYPFTYTISSANTWTQISVTIAGPTSGTWGGTNTTGIQVYFGLGVGSTYSGTAGAWSTNLYLSATGATSVVGTSGATFYITGVQLEVGSSATGYEYRQYGQELALCQRYLPAFTAATPAPLCPAYTTSTTNARGIFILPVTVRSVPTGIVTSAAGTFGYSSGSPFTASAVTLNNSGSANACWVDFTISGASASSGGTIYCPSGTATIYFTGCEL